MFDGDQRSSGLWKTETGSRAHSINEHERDTPPEGSILGKYTLRKLYKLLWFFKNVLQGKSDNSVITLLFLKLTFVAFLKNK